MRKWGILGALLAVFVLSACEDGGHFLFPEEVSDYSFEEPGAVRYLVFFESEPMPLAMHEPASGSFIGMYTDTHPALDGRIIAVHEAALGVRHCAFMEVMELGGAFPLLFVLECIAEQKMPVIVVLPPDGGLPPSVVWESLLTETARAFSDFPTPMFAKFLPLSADTRMNAAEYIAFFRYARAIFAQHAPHVAFVWSVDADFEGYMDFFPGELAVDWVGLSLFLPGNGAAPDILERVLGFYHTFQREQPIMLNLALSHFSTEDHRFHVSETAAALGQIYYALRRDFPRVKMVNYMDVNRVAFNQRDYRISMDAALREAYRESAAGFAPRGLGEGLVRQPIRSAYSAHVEDGRVYLDVRTLEELGVRVRGRVQWVDGVRRVDAAEAGVGVVIRDGQVWVG